MPSTFAQHHTKPLSVSTADYSAYPYPLSSPTPSKQELRNLLVSLKTPLAPAAVRDSVNSLVHSRDAVSVAAESDPEEDHLRSAVAYQLAVALYADALDMFLDEATEVEAESEWWADIERSRTNVAWYLLQTLPSRVVRLTRTILRTLRIKGLPITPSAFTPSSLHRLFPTTLRPNALLTALFPHLRYEAFALPFSFPASPTHRSGIFANARARIAHCVRFLIACVSAPLDLARDECRLKRTALERLRDARATELGSLANAKTGLTELHALPEHTVSFVTAVGRIVHEPSFDAGAPDADPVSAVDRLANTALQAHAAQHAAELGALRRPSRGTLLWPRLLLLPPALVYAVYSLYESRASLAEVVDYTRETASRFVTGWLLEPLRDVVHTVRAGGDEGVIVHKEGVAADYASLERMALSLAQERLSYDSAQLAALAEKIRLGDLTPVLELYEADIKRPLASALTGTLLRSVFIQVQKAKVDIDQALAGIDRLLKSQELTFAFVGVAPALAIVYLAGGVAQRIWTGGRGRGRYGGHRRRTSAWHALRRIERLLVAHAHDHGIPPRTAGMLLLSLARLRAYAEAWLPARSALRAGVLEDIGDLEDLALGRAEKLRVVERMWRCWGGVLGWGGAGAR